VIKLRNFSAGEGVLQLNGYSMCCKRQLGLERVILISYYIRSCASSSSSTVILQGTNSSCYFKYHQNHSIKFTQSFNQHVNTSSN
jgi:hypothetical protein